jgi:DNA polymerase III alpha subunit (gram-positive type)
VILAPLDVETTGLDKVNDRVIELGVCLYSTGQKKYLDSVGQLVQSDGVAVTAEITGITGITQAAVDHFGYDPADALNTLIEFVKQADAVIGHNIRYFDWPIIENWAKRLGAQLPPVLLVDTMEDIPSVEGEQLITMCAKKGFVNPEQHSALNDAQATMKLAMSYDIDTIVARAKIPTVIVQSHAPRTNTNSENKKYKFRWAPAPFGFWWKAVKETDVQELANRVPFQISVLDKSVTIEQLKG